MLVGHFRKIITLCQRLNVFPNDLPHTRCVLIGKLFLGRDIAKGILISLYKAAGIDKPSRSSAHQLSLDQKVNDRFNICTGHPHRIGNTTHRNGILIRQIQDIGFNIRTHKRERFAVKPSVPPYTDGGGLGFITDLRILLHFFKSLFDLISCGGKAG